MAADQMKLIAYGKVMEDDNKSLKEYSIKEGDFLVVMIAKVNLTVSCIFNSPSQLQRQRQRSKSRKNH